MALSLLPERFMRHCVLFILAVLTATPGLAAGTVADQASLAFSIFAGGKSQPDFMSATYGKAALADIAGKWVNLNGPAPDSGIDAYGTDVEKYCAGAAALTLASPDPWTMKMTAKPLDAEFSQTYTLVAGAAFAERTEPMAYFNAIGLGPDKTGPDFDRRRAMALAAANGMVQLYRPSPDIIVLVRGGAYPTVLARCPKS